MNRSPSPLEVGIVPTFRMLAAVVLGLLLLSMFELFFKPVDDLHSAYHIIVMGGIMLVLLLWLSWPFIHRWSRQAFLPVAIGLYLLAPFISAAMELDRSFGDYSHLAREQSLMFFPPLLIVAWQYRWRTVVTFVLLSAGIDLALTTIAFHPRLWTETDYLSVVAMRSLVLLACGFLVVRLIAAHRQQRQALEQANDRLARFATTLEQLAVAKERARLAWELHDTAAHALSGLAVQLEAAKTITAADPSQTRSVLDKALSAARQGLAETRRAIHALRGSALEDKGLLASLQDIANSAASRLNATLSLNLPKSFVTGSADHEALIFRIAQEAFENCVRHSQAKNLRLTLSQQEEGKRCTLEIADDGVGFDVEAPANRTGSDSLGLLVMQERAQLLGASVDISSRKNQGTTVRLSMEVPS